MKKLVLLVMALVIFYVDVHAQCTPPIPSNAVVTTTIDTINGGFDAVWVCPGDSFHTDGGFHNIYLEAGSFMSTGGGIDTIFVKNGATLFMNGGIHYIYYQNDSNLILAGGIATLDSCAGLSFNYSDAPYNGCFPGPVASFQSSDSTLCAGSCIHFTDMSFHATSWQWSFPGAIPSSDTVQNPQNICYPAAGSYDITLIISDSIGSDTLSVANFITVNPMPVVSGTQTGNILSVTAGFASYQWYADTALLIGENNDTLVVSQIDTFYVLVTDSNGCDTTLWFVYDNTGISDGSKQDVLFSMVPNPAKDFFRIYWDASFMNSNNDLNLEMIDLSGRIVLVQTIKTQQPTVISLKSISAGIYFIRVITTKESLAQKLIIE